jgi:transposase
MPEGRKNDRNDAEAICEAASRPRMRFVPIKTPEQQAQAMVLSTRELLVVGAMAVIQRAKPDNKKASPWLLNMLNRRPKKGAAVALANKMARIAWAMMTSGESDRVSTQVP